MEVVLRSNQPTSQAMVYMRISYFEGTVSPRRYYLDFDVSDTR